MDNVENAIALIAGAVMALAVAVLMYGDDLSTSGQLEKMCQVAGYEQMIATKGESHNNYFCLNPETGETAQIVVRGANKQ